MKPHGFRFSNRQYIDFEKYEARRWFKRGSAPKKNRMNRGRAERRIVKLALRSPCSNVDVDAS